MEMLRDPVSSGSHFLAAFLALIASCFLLRLTNRNTLRWVCVLIFGSCMTILFTSSGLYHALRLPPDELKVFQLIDMSAIFLMIAGGATPLAAILVRGRLRWALLIGEWTLAFIGIASLWIFPLPDYAMLVGCYVGMGWLSCAGFFVYWRATGWRGMRWFTASLSTYLMGAAIELANWPVVWTGLIRSHELLHFCDIAGTAFYLVFLVHYILPYHPGKAVKPSRATRGAASVAIPVEA